MSVLTREVLESSALADLHALAGELAIDGFRRLRREALVDTILERRGGTASDSSDSAASSEGEAPSRRRRRRGGAGEDSPSTSPSSSERSLRTRSSDEDSEERGGRRRRRRGGSDSDSVETTPVAVTPDAPRETEVRTASSAETSSAPASSVQDGQVVEGTIAIAANGSAALRTDDGSEVFLSGGQVRRCELVDGDRVTGPARPPRRSERYPSLIRVETVNGEAADARTPVARSEDEQAVHPHELLVPIGDDPTALAIAWLTPLGRGSRAVISGPAGAGKTEALRRLGAALSETEGLSVTTVLAGARPEEIGDWSVAGLQPTAALDFGASPETRAKAIEDAVEHGRRIAAKGGHALLLVDTLDGLADGVARRVLAAARRLQSGGSLTIIATRSTPVGGESTVVALDRTFTITGRFPAIDLPASGTHRPELLVGDEGAAAIAAARADIAS